MDFRLKANTAGGSGDVTFMVDVQYDLYPEEFKWSIVDQSGKTVIGKDVNTVTEWRYFYSQSIKLTPGQRYTLQLDDGHGDGITYKTQGYVEIYALKSGKKMRLHYDDGDFGKQRYTAFTIPSDIKTKSTELERQRDDTVRCRDSQELFHTNADNGKKDCTWLSSNLSEFGYLCELVVVASHCPSTCGACKLFKP